MTLTWSPTAAAASYLLSVDIRYPEQIRFTTGLVYPIATSPSPSYKLQGYTGGALYACLAIVSDPNNLPNPRKGECVLTEVPWP